MLTNKEKDRLAVLCDLTEDRYSDKVKESATEEYPYLQNEVAFLRKGLAQVMTLLVEKFGEEFANEEFLKYNLIMEEKKHKAKDELDAVK